jgi:hypothetical protein
MKNIDFLPDIYAQREALRRARVWWGIVVLVFGGAIGSSATAQVWLRHSLQRHLDDLAPQFAAAQAQVHELADLQAQITKVGHEASLCTYLQHPWPRTQLLADVVRPLPLAIRLTQIHIGEEELARTAVQAGPRRPTREDEDAAAKMLAPQQDLVRIQEEIDHRQTVIIVEGQTTDVARLHQYVADVSRSPLIAEGSIKALEKGPDKQHGLTQFTVRLIVRPGYVQRGNEGAPAGLSPTPHDTPALGSTSSPLMLERVSARGGGG